MAFEVRVILALKLTKTVEGAHTIMQISWNEARSIMERAEACGLVRREDVMIPHLAADETSYRKNRHFVTLLMNLNFGCVHRTADATRQIPKVNKVVTMIRSRLKDVIS